MIIIFLFFSETIRKQAQEELEQIRKEHSILKETYAQGMH